MQPAEGIRFIHAAIRSEVREIEQQAMVAETPEQLAALGERLAFFTQVVTLHTKGEEEALYRQLDQRARYVSAAYVHDHRDETALFADFAAKIAAARERQTSATLAPVRRQAIALTEHLVPHVDKEDDLVTPLLLELFSPAEQGGHIGGMMAVFPPAVMANVMPWLVAHIGLEDRVTYVSMIKGVMPSERFTVACGWIRAGVHADVWSGICAGVPGLT